MSFVCIFKTYIQPVIQIVVPIAAVILVYYFGKSSYFRQKEYELITKRYLEEGLDAISKNVDRSLAIFRYNWWQSMVVLKNFKSLGKDMRPDLYNNLFIAPDPSLFEIWRDYRLLDLVGNDIYDRINQNLDAFIRNAYTFFQDDLSSMVRVAIEGGKELKLNVTHEQMYEMYLEEVKNQDNESRRYYIFLGELQKISSWIQTERFDFKLLKRLKEREEVKTSIKMLNNLFPDIIRQTNNKNGLESIKV
jgi:hypothetical protein